MNECWINVYDGEAFGYWYYGHESLVMAKRHAASIKLLYRIHVKLKPIKLADLSRGTEQWLK